MQLTEALSLARRYRSSGRPQAAWSMSDVPTAIDAVSERASAIVALALVLDHDGELTESLPMLRARHFRVFERSITRALGEPWSQFVARTRGEAKPLPAELVEGLRGEADQLALPAEHELRCRLTWHSESEWRRNFGLNRIELHDGEPDDPVVGQDAEGIRYLFRHAHDDPKLGRRLFDLAERLCVELDEVRAPLIAFLRAELRAQQDESMPEIEAFTLREVGERRVEVVAYLAQVDPDPDDRLHGYWEVRLADFAPVSYGGVVSAIPRE